VKWIDDILFGIEYSPTIDMLDNQAKADFCIHGDDVPYSRDGKVKKR
jgi:hypothetical protein